MVVERDIAAASIAPPVGLLMLAARLPRWTEIARADPHPIIADVVAAPLQTQDDCRDARRS
jgi:hypothetical protein